MRRAEKRLTEVAIRKLRPGKTATDADIPGFTLRVTSAGERRFTYRYRVGARERQYLLGRSPDLSLADARREAKKIASRVARGDDPQGQLDAERTAGTVATLADRYLEEHAEPKKRASSVAEDRRLLAQRVLPALGRLRVRDVSRQDVAKLHHALRATPTEANRTVSLLSTMFKLAERWGLRDDGTNPARNIERYPERRRERFLSAAELRRLGEVLAEAEREGVEPPSAIATVRLALFTGCRLGEILTLRWDAIDFERGAIRLAESKTGAKSLPLAAPARALLAEIPRVEDNPYVLVGRNGDGHFVGIDKCWQRLRSRAGIEDVRIHDLRHSFASVGAAAGFGLPLIGALLGHADAATTQRYAHLAADPVRAAAERIAGEIAAGLGGVGGEVVQFSGRQ